MKPSSITLVGRAHNLTIQEEAAVWQIAVRRSQDPAAGVDTFNLRAIHSHRRGIEQFQRMEEGSLIGVIAEVPPKRQLVAGVQLTVIRLELLDKPEPVAAVKG